MCRSFLSTFLLGSCEYSTIGTLYGRASHLYWFLKLSETDAYTCDICAGARTCDISENWNFQMSIAEHNFPRVEVHPKDRRALQVTPIPCKICTLSSIQPITSFFIILLTL